MTVAPAPASATVAEIREVIHARQKEWIALWESRPARDHTKDEVDKLRALNAEMDELGQRKDQLELAEMAKKQLKRLEDEERPINHLPTPRTSDAGDHGERRASVKSLRQVFNESTQFKAFLNGVVKTAIVEIPYDTYEHEIGKKTLLTSADWVIQPQRLPQLVESVQPSLTVSDLMLQSATDRPQVSYMEETLLTNNAAEVAEGGTKPESALDFTETIENVRKIGTWIPVTDEMLADVPQMEGFVRGRLAFMVERRRESQLINGNGTSPNLRGILNRTGIQTQAKGADPTPDAIYRAIVKINVNADADPTAIIMHPNDWLDIRLLRTADGIYIWGSPSDPGLDRIWGLPVRKTTVITENTALVGAFRPFAEIWRRSGITVTASTEHSTYFVENKVAVLAEERIGLSIYRPAAFCTVTGI
jgi:HK97 family phage major capsid protein